jgi:hypothetical protein
MRKLTIAAAALIGASLFATSVSAMPANPAASSFTPDSTVIQVGSKWDGKYGKWRGKRKFWRHRRHRHHHDHDGFSFGFGVPLFLGLGYGLGSRYYRDDVDCIGRWHRHNSGRLHCHGQLVYD